ncbi:uncharacterized protein LOC133779165 [Humulus lupulus]|uniref:uncharacterized protein LOC133779165 n=1 Tax=Humulus lupulus TaxID=3486 RepID=UPI002B4054A8|nr:uncharacterized protein LOC133779165 [Humulus lupulus]
MKGIKRFRKKGKFSPWLVVPFKILERIGQVAYRLAMPPTLLGVHNAFHVTMLCKYVLDRSHILSYEKLNMQEDLSYEEKAIKILDKNEKVLQNRTIGLAKGLDYHGKLNIGSVVAVEINRADAVRIAEAFGRLIAWQQVTKI